MNKQDFFSKLIKKQTNDLDNFNYELIPDHFNSRDLITVTCKTHGNFQANVGSYLFKPGCAKCGRERIRQSKLIGLDEFIKRSKYKFGDIYRFSKVDYKTLLDDVILTCPVHGDVVIKPKVHLTTSTYGCLKCDYEKLREIRKQKLIQKAIRTHNARYDYSKVIYYNSNDPVEIICPKHGSFWQGLYIHARKGCNCPKCAIEADRNDLSEFIKNSRAKHGDLYNYDKVVYVTNRTDVIITCKHHGDFTQQARVHLAGSGCKKCFLESNRHSSEKFIENAKIVHGETYDYSNVLYDHNKKHVEIICSKHGSFWIKPNSHVSSRNGCRLCYESKGEKAIELFLIKYNLLHIREYRLFPNKHRTDFYLPDFGIHIEFNGMQHYRPVEQFGGAKSFIITQKNDIFKKNFIKKNNEDLIIIHYLILKDEAIEKELISKLKNINKHWFVIDGKIVVFKKTMDLYKAFNIPLNVSFKEIVSEISKKVINFKVLF